MNIIETFAAYDVILPTETIHQCEMEQDIPVFKAGDVIAINFPSRSHGMLRHMFRFGSVVSYAAQYNECAIDAIDRARRLGHDLHWLNAQSVSITSHEQERRTYIHAEFGDIVFFEGRHFRLDRASNQNVKMVEVYVEGSGDNWNWMVKDH